MNPFLYDPNEKRLPPEEVRLTRVEARPQPNARLVKIHLELTPFIKRPNIELTITSDEGKEVGHTSILETMLNILELTMHLRRVEAGQVLTMQTTVYYQKLPEPTDRPVDIPLPEPMVVDRDTTTFTFTPVET